MKNKISVGLSFGYLILLFVVAGIFFKSIDDNVGSDVKKIFWNAISKESSERLIKLNVLVVGGTGLPNRILKSEKKGTIKRSIEGEEFIPDDKPCREPQKFFHILDMDQSYLAIKSPIQIEQLDSFFQKELEENRIRTKTFLYFRDNKNNREGWSCPYEPSLFPGKDICLDSIQVGVQKELFLKAYIHYPYAFVAGKVATRMFPYATFPLAAVILIIGLYYNIRFIWLKKRKKEGVVDFWGLKGNFLDKIIFNIEGENSKFLSEYIDPPQEKRADICWDDRTLTFYFYEHTVSLSRQNYHLLKLFLSKPDGILTKDEISKSLWGNLHDGQTRLVKCMQRFRTKFDGIPEIEIQTGKKNYYKFTINRRSTDEQSGTEPLTDSGILSDSNSGLATDQVSGSKSGAESVSDTKSVSETKSNTETKSNSETKSDSETKPNSEIKSKLDTNSKSGIESATEPGSSSRSDSDSVSTPYAEDPSKDSSSDGLNGVRL